jgi:chemotaxis protein CheD
MAEFIGNEYTYLFPGELIVTAEYLKICTILGSCVSVCLLDQVNRIAGMNHFLLPFNKNNNTQHFKYGNESLDYMLTHMLDMGANKKNITASIFGGSSMFGDIILSYNIGQQNIELANTFIKEHGFFVRLVETGGSLGRKVVFDTSSGIINSYQLSGRIRNE